MIIGLIILGFIIGAVIFTEISIRRDIKNMASIEEIRQRIIEGRKRIREYYGFENKD